MSRPPSAQPRSTLLHAPLAITLLALAVAPAVARGPALAETSPPAAHAAAPRPDTGKKVLTVDDYRRWRTIGDERLSGDGRWVTWAYRYTNVAERDARPELHVLNLETDEDIAVPNASDGTFSPDGRWIVYRVDSIGSPKPDGTGGTQGGEEPEGPPAEDRRGQGSGPDVSHRIELRELSTGETHAWRDMRSAAFNRTSTYLLVRNRPAGGGAGPGGGGSGDAPDRGGEEAVGARGSDAILFDLASGRGQLLGSVADAVFNPAGDMLAYTVDAEVRDGNGLFVIDLRSGRTHALDNAPRTWARPAWNDAGTGLAVLEGEAVPGMRERANVLLVVPDVPAALADPTRAPTVLDTTAAGFPDGWVISERAPLLWSEDGARVFLGAMPQTPAKDTVAVEATDSTANVDVWGTADRYIQSEQMVRARRERDFTYTQAFDVGRRAFVALSDSTLRELEISPDGRWAVGRDERPYVSDWKPDRADIYRVDTATGERTLMLEAQLVGRGATFGISPDGGTYLFWKDDRFQAWDLDEGDVTTLGADAPVFVDTTYDHPGPKPPWGVAGWTRDGRSVLVEDRYDLWALPLDGQGEARNVTGGFGAENRVVLRPVRLEPIDSTTSRRVRTGREWDLSRSLTLSAFGERTKKAGFFELSKGRLSELVYDDAWYGTPMGAAGADRVLFTRETFAESPDLRVSGPDFAGPRRVTDANPQQVGYRWGHRVLFDYADRYGHPLQGTLALPDDWRPGEKRPALVVFYEKNSQNLNRYPMPELLVSMGRFAIEAVSRGYVVMMPDVHYNTGSSHEDQLDCVEAATRRMVELGYADPDHIGLHGHSYAGEGAAYIATRSRLFAAVGEGAGVTDLYTDFSQNWGWTYHVRGGSGANGNQYYVYGQGRWGASPWEMPDVYRDQSALAHADEAAQPVLIMHGTDDPTVSFNESLKFFNALRFNGKDAWLLAYPGEGHHLDELGNRKDLTVRFFQFFDHWLKGAPAPAWMTEGVPFLEKAAETATVPASSSP